MVAKERLATRSGPDWPGPARAARQAGQAQITPPRGRRQKTWRLRGFANLSPRALVAYAQELDRPVRYGDPEGCPDGSFDQVNLPAMGADQFGGDRKPKAAAAGPP